ncbi:MAG: ABC transporter substrate-binding protein/permease [Puniceicoccales bacterium]|jgi:polar amino acid transport system substrate-binding protein|nr:ABC transporter substrate-binding protein/permease [Puniceicoccales bacterium]
MKKFLIFILGLICINGSYCNELRWAADTDSGAPSVFYDGNNQLTGFEKEIVDEVCKQLNRTSVFYQNDWAWLVPGLDHGLYDAIVEGFFRSEENENAVLFSIPYYTCPLSLIISENDEEIRSIEQCSGKKVGVLCCSRPKWVLKKYKDIIIFEYPNEYGALADLKNGRVDAVVLDYPAAIYSLMAMDGLKIVNNFDKVEYLVAVKKDNHSLIEEIDKALFKLIKNGKIQAIVSKWGLSNSLFDGYVTKVVNGNEVDARETFKQEQSVSKFQKYAKLLPVFTKAAMVTIEVSICGMIFAVVLGLILVLIKLYAPRWMQLIVTMFVEAIRGTPLIIQLFFIFYGLPFIGITLQPLVAGIVALGLNYAAYESENFRAGLKAVPGGQMEAARALGMTQWQSLRYVIIPQAFCFVLPSLTNDFIAIIKESSLVSLITIVELTKTYTMVSTSSFDFFIPGIIVAFFYLLLGLPFVRLAKWAERHLALEKSAYRAKQLPQKRMNINGR